MRPNPRLEQAVLDEVERLRDQIVHFTRELLAIPSENHPPGGDELAAQEFVAQALRQTGMRVDVFTPDAVAGLLSHPAYAPFGSGGPPARVYDRRPNVVGVRKGVGSGPSLMLAAHVDTVPAGSRSAWAHAPWSAAMVEDRIYARGAVDDKGPLAASIMAAVAIQRLGICLQGDLIVESFVDEEFGGGNGALATILRGHRADAVVMLEPTNLAVCPQTYGCQSLKIDVSGLAGHAFEQWCAVNAVEQGLFVFQRLEKLREERCERARRLKLVPPVPIPLPLVVRAFRAQSPGGASIPEAAEMEVWLATMPGETRTELEAEILKALAAGGGSGAAPPPRLEFLGRYLEPAITAIDHAIVSHLCWAVERATGEPGRVTMGPPSDTYMYTNHGHMPAVVFGPGETHRAHGPDEFITTGELLAATKTLAVAALRWCGVA